LLALDDEAVYAWLNVWAAFAVFGRVPQGGA